MCGSFILDCQLPEYYIFSELKFLNAICKQCQPSLIEDSLYNVYAMFPVPISLGVGLDPLECFPLAGIVLMVLHQFGLGPWDHILAVTPHCVPQLHTTGWMTTLVGSTTAPQERKSWSRHQIVAVRGDRSTTHFCFYNVYYHNNLSGQWPPYFPIYLFPDT